MAKFYLPKNHLKAAFAVILNFIMVLLFSSPSYSQSVAGTLDFDAADGTVVTKDGDGGSTDIPNIEYQIFSTDINLIPNGTAWTYYGDIGLGIDGIVGDLTDGDPIIVIKSANGAEFSFNGILTGNRDGIMQKIIIEGFRNGVSTGSVTLDLDYMVTGVNTFTSTELTPAIFQNVDEIRLTNPDIPLGASSEVVTVALDKLVFGDPVTASANTTPTATNLTQSKSATEGGSAVALTDIVVNDADAGETITATLSLSNVAAGTLSTGTYGATTSTYNAGTGVWTVNGSVADVNAALAAVAFTPSANHDQNFTITTSIHDAANAGPADGAISFTVTAVNDDPTVSGLPTSLTFTEDATTSELDLTGIAIADVDAGTASITVVLKASAGTFSLAAGTGMTLSGNATSEISLSGKLGDVNTYLNTPSNIWYLPASNASGANVASITLTANDNGNTGTGGGTAVSLGAIDIDITAVNDAPIITTTGGTTAFYGTSITIDNGLTISDVDNTNLATATVSISGGFQDGEDELAFTNNGTNMGNITGSYNALTGVLSLTSAGATATLAQWQVALRAITYHNTSATPNTANRTVSFMATDGTDASSAVTKTVSVAGIPVITSATYDADAGVLAVTGTNMTAGDTIDPSKLTLTGEGGSTYTLTTANVTASSATAFSITLNATDKAALNQILNKNGTVSTGTTTYNLAAATNWDNTASAAADLTGNGITVSNVAVPTITSATYDASTGALVVTGTGLLKLSGATNDIVANKFTFTGEGGATYTFTDTSNGEITSGTSFTLTLSATDRAGVNLMMNKNGTSSTGGTTYNLAAAEDWAAGANVAVTVADVTGNGITASNVAVPAITSATYDASTGALVVTGTGFLSLNGATNDIVANKFTITGEGGSTYTFTDTSNGEITSGTSFTLTLSATDRAGVNLMMNKNGTSSTGGTTYNLAAAEDWAAGTNVAVTVADVTGNGITASNVAVPTITSATYDASTGALVVTGTGLLKLSGATNDIVANKFTFTGEGGSAYTFTDTSNGEITSGTSFTLTLSATDKAGVNLIINKNGTSSTGATTYNLAAAEDWAAGADAAVVIADNTGNGITVSNVAVPAITSATYDASTGALVVTGTGFLSLNGATNDIVANKFTITGEGGSTYTFTDTSNGEITSGTSFTLTLSATDRAGVNLMMNKNGTSSTGGTTYNLAAAEDWAAGANVAVTVADVTGNGITASNVAVPTITSATYDASTGALVVTGTGLLKLSGATNDIVANKFTFTGEGGSTYTFTDTSNGEITSGTSFTLTLSATDRAGVNLMINKNGTSSTGGTTYNLAAAEDWAAGADAAVAVADNTGNGITVSNVAVPAITSATYDASTGALVVTGTGFLSLNGATNDIVANKFTITGEGGSTYTFTDTSNGEITSGTSFTLTLSATDKAGVNLIINKNGTSSTGATTYNLAAAEDWAAGADAAVVVADLTGNGITASNVDSTPPTVNSVSVPSNGTYIASQNLDFTANFSENITVNTTGGTPQLALTIGSTTRQASYLSGSGTTALVFRYTVQTSDADADGITIGTLAVNGGTLKDAAGNNATLTLNSVGSTTLVLVDAIAPSISSINRTTSAMTNASTVDYTVTFSESVTGVNTGDFALTATGTAAGTVNSVSGSGTTYTVTVNSVSGDGTLRLDLNTSGTGISDAAGNAIASGYTSGQTYTLDHTAPAITSANSSTANGTYKGGDVISIQINLNEAVTVTGTPQLTLETGTTDQIINYASGSGTSTLTFTYTVQAGDASSDLDYLSTTALVLNGGTIKDGAGNNAALTLATPGAAGSLGVNKAILIDAVRPTATIVVADNALKVGETTSVTITFSEAVTGFTNADLTIANGTLSAVSSTDGGITWTATLTPTASITDATNVITLDNTGVADAAGNAGSGTTDGNNYAIDTARPTATIVVADNALKVGETTSVTITFSEAVTGFTNADLTVANGTLSAVSSTDGGITWTATLTPTASITDATNVITLDNTGVADAAGNAGSGTTDGNNYAIDTARPTATIVVADNALNAGETSLVTITFSEAVTGFTNADLTIANGTLSAVSSPDGGITWTATLTPTASITDATNVITLDNTGVADAAGNAGSGTTDGNNYAIDTNLPIATIVVADNALNAGETTSVTITFSEAVTGFTNADLTIANGTLSAVSSTDGGITWTATLTPTASITDATNVITLDNTGVADAAGNAGSGTTDGNNYAIDTARPTATIVVADNALNAGETSLVTITFSEAVTGFTNADLTIANGTLSAVSSTDGGITWTATLTPTASITDATNVITLDNTGVADAAGNAGSGTTDGNNYAIDTARPIATIVVADNALNAGETTSVTITFSEAVTGFTNADLTIANGTLSAVSSTDGGITWTATLTPTASITDATNVITLDNTGVADAAGNAGSGTTDGNNYAIDTDLPIATIVVADNALNAGETSLVTITFSEAVTGFTNADLTITNGTLSAVSSTDGGITWTATLTPTASITDATNVITLDNTGVADAAGNAGSGTTDGNNYAIDTARPIATIVVADNALNAGETSLVTITFSEAVTGFTLADLEVANGMLSSLSTSDNITYTATFTPTAGTEDGSNLITLDNTGVIDGAGNSGSGTTNSANYAVDTKAPVALAGLALAAGNKENILTWTASTETDLAGYKVYGGTSTGPTTLLQTISGATVTYTHTGLINGTTYYYRITAVDVAGNESSYSIEKSATPQGPQTITFNALPSKTYGDSDFAPGATASSGLTVTYTSDNTAVATIVSGEIHIVGAGTANIMASQSGDGEWLAANDVTKELTVAKKALTVSATASDKVYDGNTAATVTLSDDRVSGDVLMATNTNATFNNKNVGTGKTVTISGITISGTDAGNYTVNTGTTATADIAAKALAVTATASDKEYDGNTTASVTLDDDRVSGDVLTAVNTSAVFDSKNVGTNKTVTVSGIGISGTDAGNYTVNTGTTATADITAKALTVTASAQDKVYDRNATANIALSDNRVTGDVLTATNSSATFDNKNVGTGKTVTVSGISISGTDADNYTVNTGTTTTANITAKALTVTASAQDKVYDGNATANITLSDNRVTGDVFTATNSSATFDNKNVGTGKTVTVSGISISGDDAANYTVNTTTTATAEITAKALTITADDQTRFVGTDNPALTASYSGFISGENQSILTAQPILSTTATTASSLGDYPIMATGAAAQNYSISYVNGILHVKPGAPTSISLAATTLYENQPTGTSAGTWSSTSDDPNATFTYSLVNGTGDSDNGSFTITGNQLLTADGINYEAKQQYQIRVRSTTQYGFSLEQTFTVDLNDVNETPTLNALADQRIYFQQGITESIALQNVTAGPDLNQTVHTTVQTDNSGLFKSLSVNSNQINYVINDGKTGTATVTVTVKDNGGIANGGADQISRSFNLTVDAAPVITGTGTETGTNFATGYSSNPEIGKGLSANLKLEAADVQHISWSGTGLSNNSIADPVASPTATTTYYATVTNSKGFSTTASITVAVRDDYVVKPDNNFSPNGDGINDTWKVPNIENYPDHELTIFDRGGKLLYKTRSYQNTWDGTVNGEPLDEGTYYYIFNFDGQKGPIKGFITIVK